MMIKKIILTKETEEKKNIKNINDYVFCSENHLDMLKN